MLYPMFMLVMLTYVVMLITVRVRLGSVRSGQRAGGLFRTDVWSRSTEMVAKTSRHFSNLCVLAMWIYIVSAAD